MSSVYSVSFEATIELDDGSFDRITPTMDPYALTIANELSSTGQQVCKVTTSGTQLYMSPSVMPANHAGICVQNIGDYPVRTVSTAADELEIPAHGGMFIGYWYDCDTLYSIGGDSYVRIYTSV